VPSDATVVVVGSINEDVVMTVPRAPRPGETVTATSVRRSAGGKGANQAVAAARAGAAVRMVGTVGDDAAGTRMLEDLRSARIDVSAVRTLPGVATGTAYITVTAAGENTIVLNRGANARLSPEDVSAQRDLLAGAAVLLAQLEVPVQTVGAAVAAAREAGVHPVVTLAPAQAVPADLLRGLDPLLVNEHEAAFLLGGEHVRADPEAAARCLLSLGPRSAVITLGGEGAVVAETGGVQRVPAPRRATVVDTTGAGDAFTGTLAGALAQGAALIDAARAGVVAGADAVKRAGAR
jgi:ribokinase